MWTSFSLLCILMVTTRTSLFLVSFVVLKKPWAVDSGDGNIDNITTFQWAVVVLKLIGYDSIQIRCVLIISF